LINGKRVYLCHGDQIMRHDHGYRLLRFLLHNPLSGWLLPLIPYRITSEVANSMSRQSTGNHRKRNIKWDYLTILRDFASEKFSSGCDVVISAHFHRPFFEETASGTGEKTLISLGDWKTQFSYAEWTENSLFLKKFQP
jgi:UDP-2,3-diacylglucosamine hydrolase